MIRRKLKVMSYIREHQEAIDLEYQEILKGAEEIRHYWESQNRDRFAQLALQEPIGYEEARAKLNARRTDRLTHSA